MLPTVEVDTIDFTKEYESAIITHIRLFTKHAEVWLLEDLVSMLEQMDDDVKLKSEKGGDLSLEPNLREITRFNED